MLQKTYSIYYAEVAHFEQMCQSLLSQIGKESTVIKISFFGAPQNNEEYLSQLQTLTLCTARYFSENPPLISYIAQEPFRSKLCAEVVCVTKSEIYSIRNCEDYVVIDDGSCRELITGGILSTDIYASQAIQSAEIFSRIEKILVLENFPLNSIIRQWNYIENITAVTNGYQNYQEFNDSRSQFYKKTNWDHGYPAATGIGTNLGGIMIEIIAFMGAEMVNLAIDNPLQVAAYKYSQGVLRGFSDPFFSQHTTPKFERARIVGQTVYISGTAAIRGERSVFDDDIVDQVFITMQNIDHLISSSIYPTNLTSSEFQIYRIYVKNRSQMKEVNDYMTANYPGLNSFLVCADICREELLIEVEGITSLNH